MLDRSILTAFVLACVATPPVVAEDVGRFIERSQLYAECGPMWLAVSIDGADDAADIGLTKEAVQAAAESRLRAARLYLPKFEPVPYLHARIMVHGPAFHVRLVFNKLLLEPLLGERTYAATWWNGSLGTHGRDHGYILSSLSQQLDVFIADYLRVNEAACSP